MSSRAHHVLAVTAQGPFWPSFRARVSLFRSELEKYGVVLDPYLLFPTTGSNEFKNAPLSRRIFTLLSARRRLISRLKRLDLDTSVALVQRQVDLMPSLRLERLACSGRRLVWDVDDWIWGDTQGAGEHALAFLKGTNRKVRWLAARADHVIAANHILASYLNAYSDRVTIIPSPAETRDMPVKTHTTGRELVVGWIGSTTTAVYIERLNRVLEVVARKLGDRALTLLVVGGKAPTIRGVRVESRPWSLINEREALGRMDIGLMPVPDNEWTRGKSAYKAIQYMAAGIPVVADDVGVASDTVGTGGLVVRGEEEWVEALLTLARDVDARVETGMEGRRRAEREFSVERWAPVLAAILKGES